MILQALYELAHAENLVGDPDYEWKPVPWLIRIDARGRILVIEDTRTLPPVEEGSRRKPRPLAKRFPVPFQEKVTSGIRAHFLCHNAKYVFGIDVKGTALTPTGRAGECFRAFRDNVRACAADTGDEGVTAVLALLHDVEAGRQTPAMPQDCGPSDLMAFVYDPDADRLVSDRPKVRAWWKAQRAATAGETTRRCLVTGALCDPTDKHPAVKRVPGGTPSGVALVSFNASAFESYGWKGHLNAPVSREAAEACATALNRLLDLRPQDAAGEALPVRHLRLSADTVVCFWAPRAARQDFLDCLADLFEANPEQVAELYRSIWRGRDPDLEDPSPFYAMTLSGAQGRATLRDWFESTVAEAARNLAAHFADLQIVRNTPRPKQGDLPPQIPLRTLLESLAPQGKNDAIPGPLAADVVRAALRGTPYPLSLLQRALERMRAEIGCDGWVDLARRDARAALIKAVLNRRLRFGQGTLRKEVTQAMDPTNTEPGYLLGRLMAVIERMQQAALGDVGATVVDRYFSGASATPRTAFPRLLKGFRHHAGKAKDAPGKGGTAAWLERQADEILGRLQGFPAFLPLDQQGLFVLGYHHQRHWLWMKKEDRDLAAARERGTGSDVSA